MNKNNLSENIKNDINTILNTSDLNSIKEILERNYKIVSKKNINTFIDYIELNLIQEIKKQQISNKTFGKQHNATPFIELAERQKLKWKFVKTWIDDKKKKTLNSIQPESLELKSNYIPNLPLERYPLNASTIKWLGIDYDNLTNDELHKKLDIIEKTSKDIYIDYENNFIYTGIHSCFDDENYYYILKELKVPMLGDLEKILEPIENKIIRDDLYRAGVCKILEAQYNAKEKVIDILISESINKISATEIQLDYNPNNFNYDCYHLFCYLVDNYKKNGKIKFINIYYYLKDEVNKEKYSFKFIQSEYTDFIKEKYQIEIKKYQKATYDFDEQKRVLNSLEEQFRRR